MIGRVAGVVLHRGADHVVIDVRGVGYVVHCSERTLMGLPGAGQPAALWTDLMVREDLMQLLGFPTLIEKEWHRLLTSVQGIGARASMAIIGTLGPEGVGRAIALGDWNAVRAAPGVGPKIAQRVVNELRDRAPAVMAMGGLLDHGGPAPAAEPAAGDGEVIEAPRVVAAAPRPAAAAQAEALSALSNLGYGPGEAAGAVAEAAGEAPEAGTAELIRSALRRLAPQ